METAPPSAATPINPRHWKELLFPDRPHQTRQWAEHRLLTGIALLFLAVGGPLLWFWDRTIDPVGASQTLWLRLAFTLSAVVGWWQYRQTYKAWAPWLIVVWMLVTQCLYLTVLTKLAGGMGPGISGLLFWVMAGMVMFQGCTIWINLSYTVLVFIIPQVYASFGWIYGFNEDLYGLVVLPAALVGAGVQLANGWNYLMRYHAECQLEVLSKTDSLTGLLNRRAFYEAFNAIITDHRRADTHLALAYFDIDHFKAVNDTYGHSAGDAVIVNLARTCEQICQSDDLLARMGGEEFVMVFEVEGWDQAAMIAERLRQTVEANEVKVEGQMIPYTISIGLSVKERCHIDTEWMVREADGALYKAKESGRNRIAGNRA